jgi:lipoprotein NlpI
MTPLKSLWLEWNEEQLKHDRAIGQLLQHAMKLDDDNETAQSSRTKITAEIDSLKITLRNLRADIDALIAYTKMPPDLKRRGRPPKNG